MIEQSLGSLKDRVNRFIYIINQLLNTDKGAGVKISQNFGDIICTCPLDCMLVAAARALEDQ